MGAEFEAEVEAILDGGSSDEMHKKLIASRSSVTALQAESTLNIPKKCAWVRPERPYIIVCWMME